MFILLLHWTSHMYGWSIQSMYNSVVLKFSPKTEEYCILLHLDEYGFVLVAMCRGLKSEFT
jgi:hypothetical protein